jgi:hypothetical protein
MVIEGKRAVEETESSREDRGPREDKGPKRRQRAIEGIKVEERTEGC